MSSFSRMSSLANAARQAWSNMAVASERTFRRASRIRAGPGKGLLFSARRASEQFVAGTYEHPVQSSLAELVKPGAVCYDIGANVGFFTLLLARLAGPTGTVYAFEPVPANASIIERNARLNRLGNVKVLRLALSRADGMSDLLLAQHVGGAVLKGAGTPPDPAGHIIVETSAIDTLINHRKIAPPDLVKIDVEGAEMDVLVGMQGVLRSQAPIVILELDDQTQAECERKVASCQSFLSEFDYRIDRLPNAYPDGHWFVRHLVARRR